MVKKEVVRQFVARAVCIHNGKILLANKKGEAHWFLPGGRVEIAEGYAAAVKREIKEELGLSCKIKRFLGVIEHSFEYYEQKQYYEIGNFFEVQIDDIDLNKPKSSEEEMQFQWCAIDQLEKLDIRPKPVIKLLQKMKHSEKINAFWESTLTEQ
ncbi:MAG: NUDIX domain-containing protein [Candidatus Woesearchaeota archaeon]